MTDEHSDLGPWDPLTPSEVATLFAAYAGRWCIAGGWALDLYTGVQSREHGDTDVLIERNDLSLLHEALPGWELHAASGTLTRWHTGKDFPSHIHDIWCRQRIGQRIGQRVGQGDSPWKFQFMITDVDHETEEWIFRRDTRIRGPLSTMTLVRDGMPILAPEIQLLYKSKLPNRPKDEADFVTIAPHLSAMQREWLANAIALIHPDHPWLPSLRPE